MESWEHEVPQDFLISSFILKKKIITELQTFLVQKDCNKMPVLYLAVSRVSPRFTSSGMEAFLAGTNIANTGTSIAPFITASVILLNKHHNVSYFL